MEIDTGASISVVDEGTIDYLCKGTEKLKLKKADFNLRTYTGERISPKGLAEVAIKIKDTDDAARLSLVVVATLLGRNWFAQLRID